MDEYIEDREWRTSKGHRHLLDKLLFADEMGYNCGPAGVSVPSPGEYIVRPCVNLYGMGVGAEIYSLVHDTGHLPPGTFWCEKFEGNHVSIDYQNGIPVQSFLGIASKDKPLWHWEVWEICDESYPLPEPCRGVQAKINIEFIGGKPIEVNFRHNMDFRWGNTVAIPVYEPLYEEGQRVGQYTYREDQDYVRCGFLVK